MEINHEALTRCSLFYGLEKSELDKVMRLFYERNFDVGESLFKHQDEGDAFYFVHSGRIRISREAGSQLVNIAELSPGHVVGEMALISDEPRTADGTAIEKSVLWELTRKRFQSLAHLEPAIYRKVVLNLSRILCHRLNKATLRVSEVLDVLIEAESARSSLRTRVEKSKQGLLGFLGTLGSTE